MAVTMGCSSLNQIKIIANNSVLVTQLRVQAIIMHNAHFVIENICVFSPKMYDCGISARYHAQGVKRRALCRAPRRPSV